MATQNNSIHLLTKQAAAEAVSGLGEWLSFLETAGRLHRRGFSQQLLIHAQRPDATDCATLKEWNDQKRFVRSGTKSIAVLEDDGRAGRIQFLFDVADTTPMRSARPYRQWEVGAMHREPLMLRTDGGIEGSYEDWLNNQVQTETGLLLADNENLVWTGIAFENQTPQLYHDFVATCAAYAVFSRCGGDTSYFSMDEFAALPMFQNEEAIGSLGYVINAVASRVIGKIEAAMVEIERGTLAKLPQPVHNGGKDEPRRDQVPPPQEGLPAEKEKEGNPDGTDLPAGERLPVPEPGAAPADPAPGQVRQAAPDVSAGAPSGDVQPDAVRRQPDGPPAADGRAGPPNVGADDGPDATTAADAGQGQRPAGLDRADEQPEMPSRRNSDADAGVQQLSLFGEPEPTQEESKPLSSSFVPRTFPETDPAVLTDEEIRDILRYDRFLKEPKHKISRFFEDLPSISERADLLKEVYDGAYNGLLREDGERYGYRRIDAGDIHPQWEQSPGLLLVKGNFMAPTASLTLTWEQAAEYVAGMIEDGTYLTDFPSIGAAAPEQAVGTHAPPMEQVQAEPSPLTPEDIIAALLDGPRVTGAKMRIYEHCQFTHPEKETIHFLKHEYGTGGGTFHFPDGTMGSIWHDGRGIGIGKGESASWTQPDVLLKWPQVAKDLWALVQAGKYLNEKGVELYGYRRAALELDAAVDKALWAKGTEFPIPFIDDEFLPAQSGDWIYMGGHADPLKVTSITQSYAWLEDEKDPTRNQQLNTDSFWDVYYRDPRNKWRGSAIPEGQEAVFHIHGGDTVYDLENQFGVIEQFNDQGVWIKFAGRDEPTFYRSEDFVRQMLRNDKNRRMVRVQPKQESTRVATPEPPKARTLAVRLYEKLLDYNVYGTVSKQEPPREELARLAHKLQHEPCHDLRRELHYRFDSYPDDVGAIALYNDLNGYLLEKEGLSHQDPNSQLPSMEASKALTLAEAICDLYWEYDRDGYWEAVPDEDAAAVGLAEDLLAGDTEVPLAWMTAIAESGQDMPQLEKSEALIRDIMLYAPDEPEAQPVVMRADDPANPEWVQAGGRDIQMTMEGDVLTMEPVGRAGGPYVELDVEVEDPEEPRAYRQEEKTKAPSEEDLLRFAEEEVASRVFPYEIVLEPLIIPPPESEVQKLPNFHITDMKLGEASPAEKIAWNVAAITTLKEIEGGRPATVADQAAMAKYVGWGGLAKVFDPEAKEPYLQEARQDLQQHLTEAEYKAARASTLTAYYTSPEVIQTIYTALERMGFREGNVLEPAMGVGNFFGMLPESMQNAKLYGVELDPISGRIAQQLYPYANITVGGFEDSNYPDAFFDLVIGNIPFGQIKVADPRYDNLDLNIHDYFFTKALDKVRPGGVIAFVTSKYTVDKQDDTVRRYISERAELMGALRLPNTAFKKNAGTEVTTDILFLKKRDALRVVDEEWLHIGETMDGVPINQYYSGRPHCVLGQMVYDKKMFGKEDDTACHFWEDADFSAYLADAASYISGSYEPVARSLDGETARQSLPATPDMRNFSYTLAEDETGKESLYFRVNSLLEPVETNQMAEQRIRAMIVLRDCVRELIDAQLNDSPEEAITHCQALLNTGYDRFVKKYGRINSQANSLAFRDDDGYYLLCSLEILDDDGEFMRKADMFSKRTINQPRTVDRVDTPVEALAVSIAEKARVDLEYMQGLLPEGTTREEITGALTGVIFHDPLYAKDDLWGWKPADEYLSGNVREKLKAAQLLAETDQDYQVNVEALQAAQPKDLNASEIEVRLGATWIPQEDVQEFVYHVLGTSARAQEKIHVLYSEKTGEWNITNKSAEGSSNDRVSIKFGTRRMNAYHIVENTLNLRTVKIFDKVTDDDGNEKYVINPKETMLAQQKQEAVKQEFKDWVFAEPDRRQRLVRIYNDLFNAIRPREYDGSHIHFVGMNPEISLDPHQRNAVARGLYGGNTLLAHVVGAGKTYTMAATAMESKRLSLCNKSLFVVPNHLTQQWAGEFLQLYPSAKLLVTGKSDFETANRKWFCGKIATGDYDAIVMGFSQFEKIPISAERQMALMEWQIEQLEQEIEELRTIDAQRYTIKQAERSKKNIEVRMKRLMNDKRKDHVVTFEELGVDRIFIDEAHHFKNLFLYSKLRNIAGVGGTDAQKSTDLYLKCQYMDEITDGRGIEFATGTPISNSMSELYTMMRYLQTDLLRQTNMTHFDSWASTFGETVTAIELAPEGTGFRPKTRFARFYNLPELMNMWKEAADIQTADMLKLPVPALKGGKPIDIVVEPSEYQKGILAELADRAQICRNGCDPKVDNMLNVTNDGRKMALDQRLYDPGLPDDPDSKLNACVDKVYRIWKETQEKRSTQLIFSDLGTPKHTAEFCEGAFDSANGERFDLPFNVYEDIYLKLRAMGVPAGEIAFVHDAHTDTKKASLFAKVRSGQVRILLGSTAKMGAGTNVQTLLIALHHLDVPWRPSDISQREGRMIRQGNTNDEVEVYRYVTKGTFDAYSWGIIKNKQTFIAQIMTSKSPVRSCEDVDESVLTYAEVMALATGDPRIKERVDLETDLTRLRVLKSSYLSQKYDLEDKANTSYPAKIREWEQQIALLEKDAARYAAHKPADKEHFAMVVNDTPYTEKEPAGKMLLMMRERAKHNPMVVGEYCGFPMEMEYVKQDGRYAVNLQGAMRHKVSLSDDVFGNIQRLNNKLEGFVESVTAFREDIERLKGQIEDAKVNITLPFAQEAEMEEKQARYDELSIELNMSDRGSDLSMGENDEEIYEETSSARAPKRVLAGVER